MIIGISGLAGCGKSTVAKYLVEQYAFTEISFAAILKDMLSVAGFPEPADRDDKEKIIDGFNFSWRHAAQCLGSEYGRVCLDKDIWIKLTMRKLKEGKNYVFSDVRFDNEAEAIINKGGFNIKLVGRKVDLGSSASHASEAGISSSLITQVIDNNGTIGDLKFKVNAAISSHLMVNYDD